MINKQAKMEKVDAEIDEIAQRILLELESASATNLSDVRYAKKNHMSITSIQGLFEKQKILSPISFNDKTNLLRNLSLQTQTATRSEKRFPKTDA
jgi:hypothetical protein